MNKKMMYALVSVVIIIVVVGAVVGAYMLMNNGGTTNKVASATSLQYNADVTYQGSTAITLFNWAAKNIGTTDMELRIDITGGASGNYTYILNHGTQTAWLAVNGTWTNASSDFTNQWNTWVGTGMAWTRNLDSLTTSWSGTGDHTYTDSATGTTTRIYNTAINPTLNDSLFQHTT
jgi:hypothetical protein